MEKHICSLAGSIALGLVCLAPFMFGCGSHRLSSDENAITEKSVKIGMAPSQVISIKGTHYKKVNHTLEGHYTMVYPDIAVRVRDGHVYEIEQSSSGWLQQLKDVPYGGEWPTTKTEVATP